MARDLKERCETGGLQSVQPMTLHAFGQRLIEKQPSRYGLQEGYQILGGNETGYLRKRYHQYFQGKKHPLSKKLLVAVFKAHFEHDIRVRDNLQKVNVSEKKIAQVIEFLRYYSRTKRKENKIGFYDMIHKALLQAEKDPDYWQSVCSDYQFVAVDEYQDMNAQERSLTQLLVREIQTSLIVGDDLQTIHSYRGAYKDALRELKGQFPHANVIRLNKSYRLTHQNAAFVNKVLDHAGHEKRITGTKEGPVPQVFAANSRNQMYRQAAETIEELIDQGTDPQDIVVLTRFKKSYQTFARYLDQADIPFKVTDPQGSLVSSAAIKYNKFKLLTNS